MMIEPNFISIPGVDKSNFSEPWKKIDQDRRTQLVDHDIKGVSFCKKAANWPIDHKGPFS